MIMKRILFCLILFFGITSLQSIFAQEVCGQKSPSEKIVISTQVNAPQGFPSEAIDVLYEKLRDMVLESGYEIGDGGSVLKADVNFSERMATATAPIQYLVKLSVVVTLNGSTLKFNLQGLNTSEAEAVLSAVKSMKIKSTRVRKFILLSAEKK